MNKNNENEDKIRAMREKDQKLCNVISGTDWEKEAMADFILAKGRRGVVKHSELRDYLSVSQYNLRLSREVYTKKGSPDKSIMQGIYRRAYNPHTRGPHTSKATPSEIDEGTTE